MSANNFLLTTAYPIDKIAFMYENEWTPTGFDSETGVASQIFPVLTGIDAPNIVLGEWSDDDWNTSYPLGASKYVGGWYQRDSSSLLYEKRTTVNTFGYTGDTISQEPDSNGFLLGVSSSYSDKVKFRAYVFVPESYWDAETQKTASVSNPLVLDTRENYPKLVEDRIVQLTANTPVTVYHNLGFKPYIRAWSSTVASSLKDAIFLSSCDEILSLDAEKIVFQSSSNGFIYYRIYADEI